MRTAEAIIKERHPHYDEDKGYLDVELNGAEVTELINIARIEAIKEAAEVAKPGINACTVWNCGSDSSVDKQSILNLIDQVK